MELHLGHYKNLMHMAVFFVVMLKIHIIDKKLRLLEKRFVRH
jgi:hypothetical protein